MQKKLIGLIRKMNYRIEADGVMSHDQKRFLVQLGHLGKKETEMTLSSIVDEMRVYTDTYGYDEIENATVILSLFWDNPPLDLLGKLREMTGIFFLFYHGRDAGYLSESVFTAESNGYKITARFAMGEWSFRLQGVNGKRVARNITKGTLSQAWGEFAKQWGAILG